MDGIRKINDVDRINALFKANDKYCETNVVAFRAPPNPRALELIDDVEALLADPHTRHYTEEVLRTALQHIAGQFMKGF